MSARSEAGGETRSGLARERVLAAAVALADEGGLEALSMRKLGRALGVEAMSLYNHIASKDALLAGMVDLVFGEIGPPPPGADWRTAMRERAVAARGALTRHPWAIGLMESRRHPGPATLGHHEAVLACLRRGGFSVAGTAHTYALLDSYIYGFALNEQSLPFDGTTVAAVGEDILRAFPRDAYPYLAEFIAEHAMTPGYSYGDEFAFGLDLILDVLARIRDAP